MCGRYYIPEDKEQVQEIKKILDDINKKYSNIEYKTGEIYPTNNAPIITKLENKIMSWGFPKWNSSGVIINARSETANEKKMFSKALRENRCVIPASGFYEWQKKDKNKPKDKFLFTSNEDEVMYMTGVYSEFNDGDKKKEKFAILTRDANLSIADIHDRMPVIIYKNEIEDWLNDDKFIDFVFKRDNVVLRRTLEK